MLALRCLIAVPLLAGMLHAGQPVPTSLSPTESKLHLFQDAPLTPDPRPPALQEPEGGARKSPALAALYSLLLPGMGELYANGFSSGKYFLIAEGVLWLSYATVQVYGDALQKDARTFAAVRAGFDPAGKDDQFYVDVGNFLTVDEYNEKQLRDREPERLYDPAAGYDWRWQSDADRVTFKDNRLSSERTYDSRQYILAGVVLNHVASAINAARAAVAHNKTLVGDLLRDVELSGGLATGPGGNGTLMLSIRKGF